MAIPAWTSFALNSGWENFMAVAGGRWDLAQYQYHPSAKKVIIRALIIKSTTPVPNEIIANLPSLVRPDYGFNQVVVGDLGATAKVQFHSNGNIVYLEGASSGRALSIHAEYSVA